MPPSPSGPDTAAAVDNALRAELVDRAPFMIWIGDDNGRCHYFNESWLHFTGKPAEQQRGLGWMDSAHPQDVDEHFEEFQRRLAAHEPFRAEFRLLRHDGLYRDIHARVETWRDADGNFAGYVCYAIDITELNEARAAERDASTRLQLAIRGANEGIWDRPDLARDEEYWSPRFYELLGYDDGEIPATVTQLQDMVHADDRTELWGRVEHALKHDALFDFEYRIRTRSGEYRWFHSRAAIVRDEHGSAIRMTGSLADIHARKSAERALREEKNKAEVTLSALAEGVVTIDQHGAIVYMNGAAERLAGDKDKSWQGQSIDTVFVLLDEDGDPLRLAERCAASRERWHRNVDAYLLLRPGRRAALEIAFAPLPSANGDAGGGVVVVRDVTEARSMARRMAHQATHDPLTNLVNRREFERRLARILASAKSDGSSHALCYIDLDQFKVINDSCGHSAGDELLKQLARLFRAAVRKRDTVCRLGGDEFGVLMEHCALEHAENSANMLREKIQTYRFTWEGRSFAVGTSIGVVMINADSDDLIGVLRRADAACYAAKDQGRNRVHVYHDDDVELARMRSEMRWVSRINQAIESNRFELHFQPVHAARGKAVPYYEFLLRLREDGTLILPGQFLPAAERYNLSVRLDRWVISEALRLLGGNALPGGEAAVWAVNLSGASLGDERFADWVIAALGNSGVAGSRLCFEVTETAAITNFASAMDFFARLRDRGCRLALDDFGSGLSSFAYLKALPVDYLKIDGAFVRDLESDQVAQGIVKAIIDIGHLVGTTTIAEFVESEAIAKALSGIGADYLQGFHVARPRAVSAAARDSKSAG